MQPSLRLSYLDNYLNIQYWFSQPALQPVTKLTRRLFMYLNGTRSIETLRLGFAFAVWQWILVWLPGQNITCRYSTFCCDTRFYFSFSLLLRRKSHRITCSYVKLVQVPTKVWLFWMDTSDGPKYILKWWAVNRPNQDECRQQAVLCCCSVTWAVSWYKEWTEGAPRSCSYTALITVSWN